MTEAWAYDGAPSASTDKLGVVTVVDGTTFCITDGSGDLRPDREQGLFYRDTRFLNRLELEIDGHRLDPLAVQRPAPYAAEFICRPPREGIADSTLLVVRRRYVGNGMLEEVTIRNLGREVATVAVEFFVASDFAGLFEVKEGRVRPRDGIEVTAGAATVHLAYRSGRGSRSVAVSATGEPVVGSDRFTWQVAIGPRAEWTASLEVRPAVDGSEAPRRHRLGESVEESDPAAEMAEWRRSTPRVSTPDAPLRQLLQTSTEDLGSLRVFDLDHPRRPVVAAGAPWFMTLFGRDSLLTSWMLLPLDPRLAIGTLQTLAQLQGRVVNPLTEEEPGRILHEVRSGLDTGLDAGQNVYYGTIDATPLFVMLLGELHRWGFAGPEVEALLGHADRALEWIERYGDRDGDGFVEYQRATERGLVSQGWKDSFDAINFRSGALAEPPIALAEVQGYCYAAFVARSHLARATGDRDGARHWAAKAAALKLRFNEAFWLPDLGWYAVALDGDKRPVDALASNLGHCLWTGIVDADRAAQVARHLISPEMFTGFGVRTLASSMGAYNAMSYHNGSVWPHDTAIAVAGLMRYGFVTEATRIASGLLAAARVLDGRLPELFCGFDRKDFSPPVPYPTSCSPQAWAAASPMLLLRALCRLDPSVPTGRVWCDPVVPKRYLPLRVSGFHLAGEEATLEVAGGGWRLDGLPNGVRVLSGARPPLADL